ncbi:MAG TPA: hypothetical protein VL486_09790 [Verrucomicrobiae bacterium]|nr:hypothetical protein [Verrucomicrobiae bacterium]
MAPQPPPKLSEFAPPRIVDRSKAWGCVLGNLVLPGVGTFVAHRRTAGILQLIVSQTGFLFMVLWAISFVRDWIHLGSLPEETVSQLGPGLIGCVLFLLAWIWSLASSLSILQSSRKGGL